ncbi:MAG: gliding motility-associated C-terminal domain-containing protein [Bacteroidetes bacterium]|nr:gliding motility-associated C-terminal domain-containing protein [Bacteroidota bacterium]
MNNRNKQIKQSDHRMIRSFIKIAVVLFCCLLFFQSNTLKAQVINNNGAVISVTSGTVVQGDTLENTAGLITNNGTIGLRGHYINIGTTSGDGIYNIEGNWINTGIFNPGTGTVNFIGNNNQFITSTGGEIFNNLTINNSGASATNRIVLLNNVNVSGTLTITLGNVETGANKLFLSNQTITSLNYTSVTGSRIIGKFERGINTTGNYLFPIGSDSNYNPLNLNLNIAPAAGSVLSEFFDADPGSSGLPLPDADVEVFEAYNDGYWSLTSTGFSCGDYNINLDGSGFLTLIRDFTRIIKRPAGGDWLLDGTHSDAIGSVGYRNNLTGDILTTGNDFGFGRYRPRIWVHPADIAVCDGESASFSVTATGRIILSYQWQENRGFGWNNISDAGIYSGTITDLLQLSTTTLLMNGYQYRVIVTDAHGNFTISDVALLTVNPLPVATATPERDTICNNETTYIVLTSDVSNTTFTLEIVYNGSITGASTILDADTIKQTLTNPLNRVDSVIYRIIPTGPVPTNCVGTADTAVILVNPTPNIIPLIDAARICNNGLTGITLTTPTTLTDGIVTFDYTAISTGAPGDLTGYTVSDAGLINYDRLVQTLTNSTDTIQSVIYSITPRTISTGCADGPTVDIEIKVNAEPIQNLTIINNLSCYGRNEGSLDLELARGSGPFDITWTGPLGYENEGEEDIDSLMHGLYFVEVYDNLGCQANDNTTISAPDQLSGNLIGLPKSPRNKWNISCKGVSDGVIGFQVLENNYPPFDYWFVGPTGDTIETGSTDIDSTLYFYSLPEGIYEMILRDDEGCYESWTDTLFAPDPIEVQMHSPTYTNPYNTRCRGYSDGSIIIDVVSKGNGIYQDQLYHYNYFWFDENGPLPGDPTLKDQSGLDSGMYYVQITDTLSCSTIDSIRLIDPPGIDLADTLFSISSDGNYNISCYGASDGSIDITIIGGSGNYSYLWTGPAGADIDQTAADQTGLIAGSYDVRVLDINDCQKDYSFTLTEPPDTLSLTYTTSLSVTGNNNINCAGGNEGSIDINIGGGSVGNYSYEWSTSDGSGVITDDEDQAGLTTGQYNVIVTDLNGCVLSRDFVLTEPNSILTNITGTDITCVSANYDDGAADLTVTGGTGPGTYLINWSNGAATEDINNLTEGIYWVTVSDANNCIKQDSIEIHLPPPLLISIDSSEYNGYNISCAGRKDGWINIVMESGTPPYLFSWTGPGTFSSSEQNIQNLGAGLYSLQIVDDNSCIGDTTILLTEPGPLLVDILLSATASEDYQIYCYGDNTGMIDLDVTGGIEPYSYLWMDGTAESSRSLLQAGDYTVIILDKNSCALDTTVTLAQPEPLTVSGIVTDAYCPDMPDGEIELNVEGGYVESTYYYLWSNNATSSYINGLTADIYSVIITDDNNCELKDTFEVKHEQAQCLEIPTAFSPNGDGINDNWQIGLIDLYPKAVIEIFNRWGKLIFKSENGYDQPWDGTYKGRSLPVDSYYYFIDLKNATKPINGHVTIVK